MKEVVGLYGKLYHFWQVDKGHDLPLGQPTLMGSLTEDRQLDVDKAMGGRNREMGIEQGIKRKLREKIELPGVDERADEWWKEAKREKRGIYADQ
jgi:hypothetical protein